MNRRVSSLILLAAAGTLLPLLAGCTGGRALEAYPTATGGDAHRGKAVIVQYSCGSCHTIPGVPGARGLVGPPLTMMGRRSFVAGELPNTPENLVKWISSPQSVEPATAMPTLGLTDQQARDAAAYLYTLR